MRYLYIGKASTQISEGYGSGPDDVAFSDRANAVISIQRQVGEGADATFEKVILGTVQELLAKAIQAKAQAALAHAVETEQVAAGESESERHARMSREVAERFTKGEHRQCIGEPPLPRKDVN